MNFSKVYYCLKTGLDKMKSCFFIKTSLCLSLLFFYYPVIHAKTITLATGNKFAPFADEKLLNGGLATEIIETIFKRLGYETKIKFLPWKRVYNSTRKNEFAGAFPYSFNKKRGQEFYFSKPIYNQVFLFFVLKESDINYATESDLQGLSVCKPLGYNKDDIQSLLDKNIVELYSPLDLECCFKGLIYGRAQLVSIGKDAGWATIQRTYGSKEKFKTLEMEGYPNPLHLIISRTYPQGEELLEEFNNKFIQLYKAGIIQAIIKRHFQ